MSERQEQFSRLSMEQICQQYYEENERNKILLWDLEEENRVLCRKLTEQQLEMDKLHQNIDELEVWCKHLQNALDHERLTRKADETEILARCFQIAQNKEQERKIEELQLWCNHLQSDLDKERNSSILLRIALKIKKMLAKA